MGPRDIEDEVVALAALGEILVRVVDDLVDTDRPEHLELPGGIHPGHICAVRCDPGSWFASRAWLNTPRPGNTLAT